MTSLLRPARAAALLAAVAGVLVCAPDRPAAAQGAGASLFNKSGEAQRRQTPAEVAERAGWRRMCAAETCSVEAEYRDALQRRLAGTVAFTRTRQGGVRPPWVRATVRTPLGIAVEPGVRVLIDGQAEILPIKTCFPDGCIAAADISRAGIAALRAVRKVEVHVIAFGDGTTVSMEIPADGVGPLFFERSPD
ncbi:invasion associated locus B family protein [Rhodovulum sp. DZ06]|uniref:invasion associated locus B family protein n=1 Tax=Rhodovulum sp. DZ06 TaxID=3425126 RepID=UPI003D3594B2